ncbi:hypothetical protein F511_19923 [Dorcoceras hygrometricum]|uniref:Uncharacterized protein n=1 Tax=Dorcoceras hygrometricum TaxID=472368 RepID=A0A2Z7BWK2_9LAMI|nr:hypothetical protein F511_19923 [Dorcoceras hygrometricum]
MLDGITRILERQSERSGKSPREDVAERFRKQGPKEFAGTSDPVIVNAYLFDVSASGEIRVRGVTTLALLDSGAIHSFISSAFTQRMGIIPESMGVALAVTVPSGEELSTPASCRIGNLGQRVSWQIKARLYTTHSQSAGGNNRSMIFKAGQSITHHSSVVFRHDDSIGHDSDDSVGPFRHDTSVCRSQRGSFSGFSITQ